MSWLLIMEICVAGFTVVGMFIVYRLQIRSAAHLRQQSQNTWNAVAQARGEIQSLHEAYALLYSRLKELEETSHEVHCRDS